MKAASEFEVGCVKEVASPTLRAGVSVSKRSVLAMKMEAQEHKSEFTDNIELENKTNKDVDRVYCPDEAGAISKRKRDDDQCMRTPVSPGSRRRWPSSRNTR